MSDGSTADILSGPAKPARNSETNSGNCAAVRQSAILASMTVNYATVRFRPAGNGEIRVSDGNVMYAAPTLIYHYVVAHAYLPPEAFIAAVLAWKDPSGPVEHE